jgi:hypothetical protein
VSVIQSVCCGKRKALYDVVNNAMDASDQVPPLPVSRRGHRRLHGRTRLREAVRLVDAETGHQIGPRR